MPVDSLLSDKIVFSERSEPYRRKHLFSTDQKKKAKINMLYWQFVENEELSNMTGNVSH